MGKKLLFIPLQEWFLYSIGQLNTLVIYTQDYDVITTTKQIKTLQTHYFPKHRTKIDMFLNTDSELDLDQLKKIDPPFSEQYLLFHDTILPIFKNILVPTKEDIKQAKIKQLQNFYEDTDFYSDLISWECLLNTSEIPSQTDLVIPIHPIKKLDHLMIFDWKTKKRGTLNSINSFKYKNKKIAKTLSKHKKTHIKLSVISRMYIKRYLKIVKQINKEFDHETPDKIILSSKINEMENIIYQLSGNISLMKLKNIKIRLCRIQRLYKKLPN